MICMRDVALSVAFILGAYFVSAPGPFNAGALLVFVVGLITVSLVVDGGF